MAISQRSLLSLPVNLNTKTIIYPYILKPTKLHLSHYLSSLSLNNQTSSSNIAPFVAQTSRWGSQEEEKPSDGAKVFIGNLPYDVDSERLAHLFEKAGIVEIAEVIYNRETDQSRGFGFVTMSNVEEADKAVDMFQQYELNGRIVTVNKASERGSERERAPRVYEHAYRMFVGNLPWSVDNARLEQIFREYGRVVDARVLFERETGRSRGFGFVTMSTEAELNDAVASVDGLNLDGRAIKVNVAEERPRRSF